MAETKPSYTGTLHRDAPRTSERLRAASRLFDINDHETVNELRLVLGHHALLLPIFMLALISLPLTLIPFTSTLLGVPMLFLAVQLAIGRQDLWLPRRWLNKPAPQRLRRALPPIINLFSFFEHFTRPRYPQFSRPPLHHLSGFLFVMLSLAIALPIPFGNILPAFAMLWLALGHMEEDGIFIALGQIVGLLTLGGLLVIATLIVGAFGTANLLTGS